MMRPSPSGTETTRSLARAGAGLRPLGNHETDLASNVLAIGAAGTGTGIGIGIGTSFLGPNRQQTRSRGKIQPRDWLRRAEVRRASLASVSSSIFDDLLADVVTVYSFDVGVPFR
jgi:hypothetical protein